MTYAEKLRDPRWQRKRLEIFARDGFSCRDCGGSGSELHVHHCFYERGDPWDTDERFLLTLCVECHEKRQHLENAARYLVGKVFTVIEPDQLESFVASIRRFLEKDLPFDPVLIDAHDYEWDAEIRWFLHAFENPPFRKAFEEITGRAMKWENHVC